ncbi:hypothetical protein vseg_019084 [Gypsophila vaccaria]
MAAAEARAAWQRANRCFVHEDAKRAPKLASRQSSTLSSKQVDTGPVFATDRLDHNGTPYSNLPPDARWWLQPNYFHQKGLNIEHLNDRKVDVDPPPPDTMENLPQVEPSTVSEDSLRSLNNEVPKSFLDVKKHSELVPKKQNVVNTQDVLDVKSMTDYYDLLEMEMIGDSFPEQPSSTSSSADSSWTGGDKVPWWRVTDGEELASFVAHKSLLHVENCDLPPPQKTRVRREPFKHDEIVTGSPASSDAPSEAISSLSSDGSLRRHSSSIRDLSQNEKLATEPFRSSKDDIPEKGCIPVNDPGQANLLEALRHSQTRAREAEKAAKQAYTEKDHILKLFFKQASQLFAYKQWFKLLQLENLLLKSGKQIPSLSSPFPCTSKKPHSVRKTWQKSSKPKRRKRHPCRNNIGKYAAAFALGFTLVGAGLILGWTAGWLLPTF